MKTGFRLLSAFGAEAWRPPRWQVAVLMLHRVRPRRTAGFQPNAHLEIMPDFLDRLLGRLAEKGLPVVSLEEAAARVRRGDPGRAVALTFDDGYRDNHDHALPVLRRHRVPFTVFVSTGMIDGTANGWWLALEEIIARADSVELQIGGRPYRAATATDGAKARAFAQLSERLWKADEAERDRAIRALADRHGFDIAAMLAREMMDWDRIRTIADTPGGSLGGHTIDHPALSMLPLAAVEREIEGGLDRIAAETGRRPTTFAYPYGHARAVGRREIDLVARLGLDVAVTTERGMIETGAEAMTAWPRVTVNGLFQSIADFDVLMSGLPFALEDGWRRFGRRAGMPVRRGLLEAAVEGRAGR